MLSETTIASGNNSAATTSVGLTLTDGAAVGDWVLVFIAQDNGGTNGAVSMQAPTDSKGNTYTALRAQNYDPGAADAGVTQGVYQTVVTTALSSGDTITLNSANSDRLSGVVKKIPAPASGKMYSAVEIGGTAGAASNAPTTTTPSLLSGDLIFGVESLEANATVTGDSDTTRGSWGSLVTATANTGTSSTSVRVVVQSKLIDSDGTQTYNTTHASADVIIGYVVIREADIPPADTDPLGISWHRLGWPGDPLQTKPTDGVKFSSWRDAAGSGNPFTQGNATKQPYFILSAPNLNGKNAWDHFGPEGIQSDVYSSISPVTIAMVAYIAPTQPNSVGWLASGYDTNIKLNANGYICMNAWGSTSDTPVQTIDRRGQRVLVMAYFNGASSKWRVNDAVGAISMAGGNTHSTRLTAAAWDGNVNTADTTSIRSGLIGIAVGDHITNPGFLGWVANEFDITTGYGSDIALPLPVKFGLSQVDAIFSGTNPVEAIYQGSTLIWP